MPAALPASLTRILATGRSAAPTLLRLTVAVVLFPHGAQKALGWFGGGGFTGTLEAFQHGFGIGPALATVAIAAEFLGPIALALGIAVRPVALALAGHMGVAASFHLANGFFMNWFGTQAGEGIEFHVLIIGALLSLVIAGAGRWSVDRQLTEDAGR
jgi:putative oxidoreductase